MEKGGSKDKHAFLGISPRNAWRSSQSERPIAIGGDGSSNQSPGTHSALPVSMAFVSVTCATTSGFPNQLAPAAVAPGNLVPQTVEPIARFALALLIVSALGRTLYDVLL
jgi:hypothetical protein